jgi:predicted amidohydrolase YtcJ
VRVVGGWTEFQFAERRMPTLDEINDAAPDTCICTTAPCSTAPR